MSQQEIPASSVMYARGKPIDLSTLIHPNMDSISLDEPITREKLQNLKKEKEEAERIRLVKQAVSQIKANVILMAQQGGTVYINQRIRGYIGKDDSRFIEHILTELRSVFPDCDVVYHESKNIYGQITECAIRIDWS